jgi:choline-sulfatase
VKYSEYAGRLLKASTVLLLTLIGCRGAIAASAPGPSCDYNVLFLMSDEHTPRVLGCYGDALVKTPTLDSLAANGVRFTAAYCQNPICVPSRVSFISGRMPCHLNAFGFAHGDNQTYQGITTLADVFNQADYKTGWFGKTHWGNPRFQEVADAAKKRAEDEGPERLPQDAKIATEPVEENLEHLTANDALSFLERNQKNKFFLGVSFRRPHFPFIVQKRYYELYQGKVTLPRAPQDLIKELPAVSKQERKRYHHAEATEADILRARAMYYGMVTYVDEEFGRILKQLDDLGLREKTIIIYTADHGEMLGDRGIWYKNSFYDGSASIPFIWSFPKELPRGKVVTNPAMNMDIFPTLCELCKLPKPAALEGSSLVSVMKGADDGSARYALSENYRNGFAGRMIRTAKWKYFFYNNGEEYLYDMQADPGEEVNLAKKPELTQMVQELKAKAVVDWKKPGKQSAREATQKLEKASP